MKKVLLFLMCLVLSLSAHAQNEEPVKVIPDELIVSPDNPVLLVFSASWCAPCHRMEQFVFTDPEVAAILKKYNVAKLDVDTPEGSILERRLCSAAVVPYFIIFDKEQNRIGERIGASDASTFAAFLRQGLPDELSDDVDGGFIEASDVLKPNLHFGVIAGGGTGFFMGAFARLSFFNGNFMDMTLQYSSLNGAELPVEMNFKVAGPFSMGAGVAPSFNGELLDISLRGRADFSFDKLSIGARIGYGLTNLNRGDIVNPNHALFYGAAISVAF